MSPSPERKETNWERILLGRAVDSRLVRRPLSGRLLRRPLGGHLRLPTARQNMNEDESGDDSEESGSDYVEDGEESRSDREDREQQNMRELIHIRDNILTVRRWISRRLAHHEERLRRERVANNSEIPCNGPVFPSLHDVR